MKCLVILASFLFFINSAYAKCGISPSFILDTEILSCKVVYFEDEKLNDAVLLSVKVNDEIPFTTSSPMNWNEVIKGQAHVENFSVKNKTIPLLFVDNEYSCFKARSAKEFYKGNSVFFVNSLCCDSKSEVCEQTNHIGYRIPSRINFKNGSGWYDPALDFNEHDVLKE